MDPLTKDVCELVKDHLPELYWHGYNTMFGGGETILTGEWILDGQTPVPIGYVLDALNRKGVNPATVQDRILEATKANEARLTKQNNLRESARSKLTPEEIEACGL